MLASFPLGVNEMRSFTHWKTPGMKNLEFFPANKRTKIKVTNKKKKEAVLVLVSNSEIFNTRENIFRYCSLKLNKNDLNKMVKVPRL